VEVGEKLKVVSSTSSDTAVFSPPDPVAPPELVEGELVFFSVIEPVEITVSFCRAA